MIILELELIDIEQNLTFIEITATQKKEKTSEVMGRTTTKWTEVHI